METVETNALNEPVTPVAIKSLPRATQKAIPPADADGMKNRIKDVQECLSRTYDTYQTSGDAETATEAIPLLIEACTELLWIVKGQQKQIEQANCGHLGTGHVAACKM
jgi:hypothetical protein